MERGISMDAPSAQSPILGPLRDTGGWDTNALSPPGTVSSLRGRTTRTAAAATNMGDNLGMARSWPMSSLTIQQTMNAAAADDPEDCGSSSTGEVKHTTEDTIRAKETIKIDVTLENSREDEEDSTLKRAPVASSSTPKSALNVYYAKRFKKDSIVISKSSFTTWNDGGPAHNTRFTSVFTCPISGERFRSARYGPSENYTVQKTESTVDGIMVEVIWYTTIHLAEHAAAARALDCIYLREGKAVNICSSSFCIERPYMSPDEAPPLPPSAPISLMVPCSTALVTTPFCSPSQVPKATLNTYFGKKYKNQMLVTKSCYFLWDDGAAAHLLRHTAIFKCPATGECFPSGRYGKESCYVVQEEKTDEGVVVQVVWYEKKNLAEHAAAARALDCFHFRDGVVFSKICVEMPYTIMASDSPPLSSSTPDHIRALLRVPPLL